MAEEIASALTGDDAVRRMLGARIDDAFRLATFILHDRLAAEDAVQEAALLAWRRRGSLREPEAIDGWFTRIVVNVCRDELRRRTRRPMVVPIDETVPAHGTDDGVSGALPPDLGPAISRLSPDEQSLLALRFGRDLTVPDIAGCLGIPEGTVKSRLHSTLQHLRAALDAERRSEEATR